MINRRVQSGSCCIWSRLINWSKLLITEIGVGTASDAPRLEMRNQMAFALEQTLLISGKTAIGAFRYKQVGLWIKNLLNG